MGNKHLNKLRSKKGTTMVEVLAAVLVLAIVVTAVLTTISFSQRTILSGGSEGKAAAEAQSIADTLISQLSGTSDASKVTVSGAVRVPEGSTFPDATKDKQFKLTSVENTKDSVKGYQIQTAVYYSDSTGRKCVQMTAFAAQGGVS